MTRYIEAFSWPSNIQTFLETIIKEKPLLNVCSGATSWGDRTVDLFEKADLHQDWTALDFPADTFGAVFADPPWDAAYKRQCSLFMHRALRIAPVVYLMSPWVYGSADAELTNAWIRHHPGVNQIIAITRYQRSLKLSDKKVERGTLI